MTTTDERVGRLQSLLSRIIRNAQQPRPTAAAPSPGPVARKTNQSFPAPPPNTLTLDAAVDDLLGPNKTPPRPQPPISPSAIDSRLESAPPPAPSDKPTAPPARSGWAAPEPTPEPFTAPSSYPPFGQGVDPHGFPLESEVSEIRAAGPRDPSEPETSFAEVAAVAEELSEEDLVEIDPEALSEPPGDIVFDDEPSPASSKRVAGSTGSAGLAHGAPHQSTPPESGPQEATAPSVSHGSPSPSDVDSLLDDELSLPERAHSASPTPEQLGQTIDLEEARGPRLELDEPPPLTGTSAPPESEELDIALPSRDAHGRYDDDLAPPPEARAELDAHRRRFEEEPPPPVSLASLPSDRPAAALASASGAAETFARPPLPAGSPEHITGLREQARPLSFLELLDASLGLGQD